MIRMCRVCQGVTARQKCVYCRDCNKEVGACKNDADKNGWSVLFDKANSSDSSFRSLVLHFKANCPARGRGSKRPPLDWQQYFNGNDDSTCSSTKSMSSPVQTQPRESRACIETSECFQDRKVMERRCAGALDKCLGQVHIHGISNGSRQLSGPSKKRVRDAEDKDSDDLAACGEGPDFLSNHPKQKVARVSSAPRSIASGSSRPCHAFVTCSFLFSVNADASRPCDDIIAAIETHHKFMLKLYNAGTFRADRLLYMQVLELCRKLLNVVNQGWAFSDPASSIQASLYSDDLALLPQPDTSWEMNQETFSDVRVACLYSITKEDVDHWAKNCGAAADLVKQFGAGVKAIAAQVCDTSKLKHFQDTANKRQEAEQKDEHAAATAALRVSSLTVFDLPPHSGFSFQTVTEDVFLAMSAVEQTKMSMRPLLIRGCWKLKEQLANIPELDDQMQSLALQLSTCLSAPPMNRRCRHA